jgi:septum site-determining protein MinD
MSRVYAVASGKGGVGKTTTAAALGGVLAEAGHGTVVVDVDLGMGNLASVLGVDVDEGATLNDALAGTADAEAAVRGGPTGPSILPASDDLDDFAAADPGRLGAVLDTLDAAVVLLDTSAGLSHDSVEPLRVADEVVIVSTTGRGAVGDAAKTREVADRFGTPVAGVVVTRTTVETDATSVGERLDVPVLGSIPEDPAVAAAAEDGTALTDAAPGAPATDAYRRLAATLRGDDEVAETVVSDGVVVADAEETSVEETTTEKVTGDEPTADEPPDDDPTDAGDAAAGGTEEGDGDVDEGEDERTGFLRWLLR